MSVSICSACGKPDSGIARGDFCEYCMAPMIVPAAALESRRCYGCNSTFEIRADLAERRCEQCRAVPAEGAAPAVLPTDDGDGEALAAFLWGLAALPLGALGIWFVRATWQVTGGILIWGFIGLMVVGGLLRPFVRPKRRPLAVEAAGYAGVLLSLVLVALVGALLE